jgi:glycosyltransferase involved in cell wall biosynthesis
MYWFILLAFVPYLYYLLRICFSLKKIKTFYPVTGPELFISVIIACRNEEKNLPSVLSAVASQNYNHVSFELIIVDDNSSDSTFDIASGFKGIKNLKVLKNKGSGKKSAIRRGIEVSEGEVIATTDADCRMGEKWLATIASFYHVFHPDLIICPVKLEPADGFFGKFQELEFLSLQGITAATAESGNPVMCNGANLSFLKESYNAHSGDLHDELLSGDDIFLLHSLKKNAGKKILWLESPDTVVTTRPSGTILSYLRQRVRWVSKAGSYTDRFTVCLGIITLVTILVQLSILTAGLFDPWFLLLFTAAFIIKSIPDFMILLNTTKRYGNRKIMRWFLPSQLVYPFYVLAVVTFYLIKGSRKVN